MSQFNAAIGNEYTKQQLKNRWDVLKKEWSVSK